MSGDTWCPLEHYLTTQAGEAEQHGGGATGACGGVEQPTE